MKREYTDETPMKFGKYKGVKMANIPPEYLLWLYENGKNLEYNLKAYLQDNIDVFKSEIKYKQHPPHTGR